MYDKKDVLPEIPFFVYFVEFLKCTHGIQHTKALFAKQNLTNTVDYKLKKHNRNKIHVISYKL